MSKIIDLDILRPEPQLVKIDGQQVDVSFIPCGITFELDAIVQELVKLDGSKVQSDPVEMRRAFDLGVKLCSVFCQHTYSYMDEEWFRNNTTSEQITAFANAIQSSLMKMYSGIGDHAKN